MYPSETGARLLYEPDFERVESHPMESRKQRLEVDKETAVRRQS